MISGLPDRPLLASETLTVSHERDDLLVMPATPDSLVGDDGTLGGIRDILVFTANVVTSLAYTDPDGWTVVAKATWLKERVPPFTVVAESNLVPY